MLANENVGQGRSCQDQRREILKKDKSAEMPIISFNTEAGGWWLGVGTLLAVAKQIVSGQIGKYTEVAVRLAKHLPQII